MNAIELNSTFDLLTLVEGHTTLKRAGRYWSGPCPFCGGQDRFELKQSDRGGYVWRCRHCAAAKGYSTSIDYYMRYFGLDFKSALAAMGGDIAQPAVHPPVKNFKGKIIPPLPDSTWQINTLSKIDTAAGNLLNSKSGQPGRDYLTQRGLHLGTWSSYSLGFVPAEKDPMLADKSLPCRRPAICIPWLDDDGQITGVNWRFIDNHPGGLRYKLSGGSKRTLFGLNAVWHASALMICEGELNCCSIHQANAAAGGLALSVVSIGGEEPSEFTLTLLKVLVKKYERVFCWIDQLERARPIVGALNRPVNVLKSPDLAGVKMDANAMLQKGILVDFLRALISNVCAQTGA